MYVNTYVYMYDIIRNLRMQNGRKLQKQLDTYLPTIVWQTHHWNQKLFFQQVLFSSITEKSLIYQVFRMFFHQQLETTCTYSQNSSLFSYVHTRHFYTGLTSRKFKISCIHITSIFLRNAIQTATFTRLTWVVNMNDGISDNAIFFAIAQKTTFKAKCLRENIWQCKYFILFSGISVSTSW